MADNLILFLLWLIEGTIELILCVGLTIVVIILLVVLLIMEYWEYIVTLILGYVIVRELLNIADIVSPYLF